MDKYAFLLFNTTRVEIRNDEGEWIPRVINVFTREAVTEKGFAFTDLDAHRLLDMKDKLVLAWREDTEPRTIADWYKVKHLKCAKEERLF